MQREESDLYGLALDEFVKARTELERRLRKEGDRERAAAVKKLPKPSVAAWAVNQASRSQPKHRRELLEASAELRDTQERLIAGDASAADLDKAARRQRAAIDALADAAAGLLTTEGKGMADPTLARVRETLAAVAADEELAELFEAGILDRERRPAGLGFGLGGPGGEADAPEPSKPPSRQKPEKQKPGDAKKRAKAEKARQEELSAAREQVKEAKAAERDAQKRQKAAGREAEKAAKALERAERAEEQARERAAAAARVAQEARGQLDATAAAAEEAATERESAEAELDRLGR